MYTGSWDVVYMGLTRLGVFETAFFKHKGVRQVTGMVQDLNPKLLMFLYCTPSSWDHKSRGLNN